MTIRKLVKKKALTCKCHNSCYDRRGEPVRFSRQER
jgi:Rieske Fe-S protein